jgi:hypothetical protein
MPAYTYMLYHFSIAATIPKVITLDMMGTISHYFL